MTAPRILVAFHSSEGQTAKIAEHVGDILTLRGARVDVVDTDLAPAPDAYHGVVVGDSIHLGHHSRSLVRYLRAHADDLAKRPTALFQVSMTSAKHDPEHSEAAERMVGELREQTGFAPDQVAMFAGAVKYTQYGWVTRHVMRSISAKEGSSTDTSCDHEYTEWADVEHFATDVFELVVRERVPVSRTS